MKNNGKLFLYIAGGVTLLGLGGYFLYGNEYLDFGINDTEIINTPSIQLDSGDQGSESYTTISPRKSNQGQTLTLIGTVISNEFATIYARRNGIIKDLYIDIGDSIKENQTIGELLPPGDIGQSSANIYEKQVRVQEAEANLAFMQKVSQQMIGKASLNKELQELAGDSASAEMLNKIQVDIESSKRELDQIQKKHQEQLNKIENDISQENTQALLLVESTIQTLEHILLGDNHNSSLISTSDMRTSLGIRNTATRGNSLSAYRRLKITYDNKEYESVTGILDQTYTVLSQFLEMIEYSTTTESGEMLTQKMLEDFTQMLLMKQTNILNTKEMFEDLDNAYATTKESQAQEIVMLENMIDKGGAMLGEKTAVLKSALDQASQQVDLVKAEQDLKIQQAANMIDISKANLAKEYATSGNEKITTPFGGTVSKRMVQVGDVVSMGMPLYELIDVPTSLAKKAKRVVEFGLPEEYSNSIKLGDSIEFSSAQSDDVTYSGTINRISPQVDQMSKTVTVQAILSDEISLSHNSRVNISLPMIEQVVYQVPSSTIEYTDGEAYIPLLDGNNDIKLQSISVLAEDGEFADIQGEISVDDRVVTNYSTMN